MKKKILSVVFVLLFALLALATCGSDTSSDSTIEQKQPAQETVIEEKESEEKIDMTIGQKNALRKAAEYLDFTSFSKIGLIEQLEFEQFSTEDATFAVENCGADWNEQAAKKAAEYLDFTSFSKDGLIEQLEFEGFTHEQAVYGVEAVGY